MIWRSSLLAFMFALAITLASPGMTTGEYTKLAGSTIKWSAAEIYERSGTWILKVFADPASVTYNAAAYYTTIKAGERYSIDEYSSAGITQGTYVSTTATGIEATVEFKSKRKYRQN